VSGVVVPSITETGTPPPAPTRAVREARPEELAEAWALQREAFDLAEGQPAPPAPGLRQDVHVATDHGRVVSCLTLLHARLSFLGADIPMGGIRHVATRRDVQNQGFATELMRQTLRAMPARGLAVSVLFPFSFRYYRKFGYELGGNHCHVWCRPSSIPAFTERSGARRATPGDVPALTEFSRQRALRSTCSLAYSRERWHALSNDPALSVFVCGADTIDGVVVTAEGRDSYGGRLLRVQDLAANSQWAWRCLLGHLSQTTAESVEWNASPDALHQSRLLRSPAPLREGFRPRAIATVRPMFQLRVVDVAAALRARARVFPRGVYRLGLKIRDELLPENTTPLGIHGTSSAVSVRAARASDPTLCMDIRTFSQLFCGYLSPGDAASQGLLEFTSPGALDTAEALFPAGDPFLSDLDRF
jgi:predicted acetyltransferase